MKEIIVSVATSFAVLSSPCLGQLTRCDAAAEMLELGGAKNISNYEVMGAICNQAWSEGEGEGGDLPVSFVDNFMCPGVFAVLGARKRSVTNRKSSLTRHNQS